MQKRMRFQWVFAAALIVSGAAVLADPAAPAPQAVRTIIDRHDEAGVAGKEEVQGTAELPAGATIGWHLHHGDEVGYVLKGQLVWKVKGQPDRTLQTGDHFFNPAGSVHSLATVPGTEGGTALSTWVVDKGSPLAEPVP
jgi:quercetin dioxygenase-like cupin family protein